MHALVCPAATRPAHFGQVAPAQQQHSGREVPPHEGGSSSPECPCCDHPATSLRRCHSAASHATDGAPAAHHGEQMQAPPQRDVPACCSPGCRPLQTVRPPEHAQWCRALLRGLSASSGRGSRCQCSLQTGQQLWEDRPYSMAFHNRPTLDVAARHQACGSQQLKLQESDVAGSGHRALDNVWVARR